MNKIRKHIILFFTTAGIGNLIYFMIYLCKNCKRKTNDIPSNEEQFYYEAYQNNLLLAQNYEKEYNLDKALFHCRLADNSFIKYIEENKKQGIDMEYMTPNRVYESRILVKMNKLDEAIKVLNTSKQLSIYEKDKRFKDSVDIALEDVLNKKKNGYIYKPRNKKTQF
jgi:hypothetical protein|nr:MAG TPA: hypothetical protein [Caudoviricetes sp.]